jgi:hypothetical protein
MSAANELMVPEQAVDVFCVVGIDNQRVAQKADSNAQPPLHAATVLRHMHA